MQTESCFGWGIVPVRITFTAKGGGEEPMVKRRVWHRHRQQCDPLALPPKKQPLAAMYCDLLSKCRISVVSWTASINRTAKSLVS